MSEELLTAQEIGKRLGKPWKTILEWRKQGIIPAEVARGNFIRFDYTKVREALRKDAESQVQAR